MKPDQLIAATPSARVLYGLRVCKVDTDTMSTLLGLLHSVQRKINKNPNVVRVDQVTEAGVGRAECAVLAVMGWMGVRVRMVSGRMWIVWMVSEPVWMVSGPV